MTKDKQTYLEQIDKYYKHSLASHLMIEIGMTPTILLQYGAPQLPLVMQQSTLTKCVRKRTGSRSAHNLPRSIIESLPEQISNPIFLIQDKDRNSIALIIDSIDRDNNKILIAVKLKETRKEVLVNEIKSIYGKTNLKEYLLKHSSLNQLHVIDNRKAEMLSRVLGLQLPTTLIASSYAKRIPLIDQKVNTKMSIHDKLEKYQKEIQSKDSDEPHRQKEQQKER